LFFIGSSHDGVGHGVDRRRWRNRGSGRLAGITGTVPCVAVVAEDEAVLGAEQAADALIDGYRTFGGPSCPSRVVSDEANCGDTRRQGHLGCGATSAGNRAGGVGADSDEVVAAEAGAFATDKFIEEHYGDIRRTYPAMASTVAVMAGNAAATARGVAVVVDEKHNAGLD